VGATLLPFLCCSPLGRNKLRRLLVFQFVQHLRERTLMGLSTNWYPGQDSAV
jgi:hypothetical protein